MFNLLARKSLNLVMMVSLLVGSTGGHQKPSAIGAASPRSTAPVTLQNDFGTQFTYDPDGNLLTRTDANGATTRYEYDADNRLVAIRYPDKTSVTYSYDSLGQRTKMVDSIGTTSYEYDIHGLLLKIIDPNKNILQYAYDPRGLVSQLIYPDGSLVNYTWDVNRQLSSVQDVTGVTRYKYDLGGKLTDRILPNGVTTHYEYDYANRLTDFQHSDPGGALLQGYKYQLDALGNRTQMMQIGTNGNLVTRYTYDNLKRLVGVTTPDGEILSYKYNAIGGLASMTSSKIGATRFNYNELGQLAELKGPLKQIKFNYDINGNLQNRIDLLSKETTNYKWDFENRLISLNDGVTSINYGYNGDGSLYSKSSSGLTSFFLSDPLSSPGSVLAVYDKTGKINSTYVYGNTLIDGRNVNSPDRFFIEDGVGSFGKAVDSRGLIIDAQNYSAFSDRLSVAAKDLEDEALEEAITAVYRASNEAVREVTTQAIPFAGYLTPALQIWDLFTYTRAIWYSNHATGNLPRWLTGPEGPEAFRFSPMTSHLVFAWDLLKGTENLPFRITTIPINDFYNDGMRRLHTSGYQTIEETYSSTLGGSPYMRRFGYDPSTDSFTKTIHTMTFTTETTGYNQSGWTYQIPQDTYVIPQNRINGEKSSQTPLMIENLTLPVENNSVRPDTKRMPFFFPPDWPNGGGAAVGGVLLDKAAQVLVNLNDITGASFDPKTGQVTLIGRQDASLNLPPMNMDDLVVAIRSVYAGVDPGVTMIPIDPTMKNIKQRVQYFGPTRNTHFGKVMFEADYYLKSLAAGEDPKGQPVKPNVPGFKSEIDLMRELKVNEVPWHRNWFVPGEIELTKSADGHSITFDKASIKLESRFIKFLPDGSIQDVPGSSPVTDAFTSLITQNYDEIAKGKKEMQELVQLAKITAFVRWLHDNNIPVDLSWVNNYQVKEVETPEQVDGINNGVYMGGVEISTANTYVPDASGAADILAKQATVSRPADLPVKWDFQEDGQTYTAVAFNVAPARVIGGYSANATDISLPLTAGQTASFTRQYNSLDLGSGPLGSGWSQVIPSLTIQTVPVPDSPDLIYTQAVLQRGTDRAIFTKGANGLFHPNDNRSPYKEFGLTGSDPFTPTGLPDGFSLQSTRAGQPIDFQNKQGKSLAISGFTLLSKDGSALAFDPGGRIIAQRDIAGKVLAYQYDANRLTAITGADGHGLQFAYDSSGLLTDLNASDGQAMYYTYDASRDLTAVTDETGKQVAGYAYDTNGRLSRVSDAYGQTMQITYDGLGRVLSVQSPSGTSSIKFDDAANTMTYTDSVGAAVTRQYDDQKRLISETDPSGKTVHYKYDQNDHLAAYADRSGNTTTYQYDENGFLTSLTSPLGEQTRLWGHNEMGLPRASIDPSGGITLYQYDGQGRVTAIQDGIRFKNISADGTMHYSEIDPQSITYSYNTAGNLASVRDAAGSVTNYAYDDLGNLTNVQLPGGGEVRQTFDDRSRLTSIADATGYQVDFGYDQHGQLITISTPAGQTQYQYTNGLVTAVTDPLNHTTQYGYDAAGRLANVTEPGGGVTSYAYDAAGNLVGITDALGSQIQFQYDANGRVVGGSGAGGSGAPANEFGVSESPNEQGDGDSGATPTPAAIRTSTSNSNPWIWLGAVGVVLLVAIVIVWVLLQTKRKRSRAASNQDWMSADDDNPFKI